MLQNFSLSAFVRGTGPYIFPSVETGDCGTKRVAFYRPTFAYYLSDDNREPL